jgi:hypothetical protein
MPKVATNGGTRRRLTRVPLVVPTATAMRTATRIPTARPGPPGAVDSAITTAVTPITAATEMSSPAVVNTRTCPMVTMPRIDERRRTSCRLSMRKNSGASTAATAASRTMATHTPRSDTRSSHGRETRTATRSPRASSTPDHQKPDGVRRVALEVYGPTGAGDQQVDLDAPHPRFLRVLAALPQMSRGPAGSFPSLGSESCAQAPRNPIGGSRSRRCIDAWPRFARHRPGPGRRELCGG